jgi:hypothetical protein
MYSHLFAANNPEQCSALPERILRQSSCAAVRPAHRSVKKETRARSQQQGIFGRASQLSTRAGSDSVPQHGLQMVKTFRMVRGTGPGFDDRTDFRFNKGAIRTVSGCVIV